MQWEYKSVYIDFAQSRMNLPDAKLTKLGLDSWEAIGTYKEHSSFYVLMKRPMSKHIRDQITKGDFWG